MTVQNKRLALIMSATTLLLLIPLVAMQFTTEVNWTGSDFVIAGVLLYGTGLLCELVLRKVNTPVMRIVICCCVLAALILVWAELAVGVFGTPWAGN